MLNWCRPRCYTAAEERPSCRNVEAVWPSADVGPSPAIDTVFRMHPLGRAVDSIADANGFSGVVRVDRGDDVELANAYGLAHRGYEIPNTLDTRFAIASGTKGLTALAVVSLIDCNDRAVPRGARWARHQVPTR